VAAARVIRARANPSLGRELGLWLLLAEDARIALLLLNRARYYVLSEMFGVGPAQANLVTFAALLGLADAAQRRTAWLRAPGTPTRLDVAIGAAAATTALAALAGPSRTGTRDELFVAFAVLHRLTAPAGVALRGVARAPWRLRRTIAGQAERLANATSARG
jgi:hypothetical protein